MSGSSGEGAAIRAILWASFGILWLMWKAIGILFRLILLPFLFWKARQPKERPTLSFPLQSRFAHTLIVGGSGHGKTQLLQAEFVSLDLARVAMGSETVIFIDSQGDMLRKILHLAELSPEYKGLSERLVFIDPTDTENPPCLNLFDFGVHRIKDYSPRERESLANGAIYLYEYMFGKLLGAELTNRQGVIFRYLARLLMVVPSPTIRTLMDFLEEPERVKPFLSKLDFQSRRFFTTLFMSASFDTTRQQILMRLWGVLSNETLERMFSHAQNKLDLFDAMNRGSLILINTAKEHLKQDGCELFGRFMITLISQATQERAALPEAARLPTFVYIDEAVDYFDDSNFEGLLNTARKYNVGVILATQNLDQFDRKLRASVLSSTAIKFAGGVSESDAKDLAKEMMCEPQFIRSMMKTPFETRFAVSIRDFKPQAVQFSVPLGLLENRPQMGEAQMQELIKANQLRYTAPYEPSLLTSGIAADTQNRISFGLEEPEVL